MAMKSWIGTLACAVLALGLSTAAEAQTCSAIQDDAFDFSMDVGDDVDDFRQTVGAASGKPRIPTPTVGLGISLDHQAASLCCSSHCSKNNSGERPLSDPWGRSTLYS